MSDSHPVERFLGLANAQEPAAETPPSADEPTPTTDAGATEDEVTLSLGEALAELEGQAPHDAEQPGAEPTTDATAAEDGDPRVLALQTELEALRADKAQRDAATEDAQFYVPWQRQQQTNDQFFDAEEARIRDIGTREGRSPEEIEAMVYARVEKGQGFGVQRLNPQTGQMDVLGRIDTALELEANLRNTLLMRERSRAAPSALDALTTKHQLSAEDRNTVGQFIGQMTEAQLETVAAALAAKNARITQTQTQATTQAAANVARRLSSTPGPGTPGSAPAAPQIDWTRRNVVEARQGTEYMAKRLGLVR